MINLQLSHCPVMANCTASSLLGLTCQRGYHLGLGYQDTSHFLKLIYLLKNDLDVKE